MAVTTETLKAPFPYFGGKSKVASLVWERFGNVPNYVEPFAGSLAVLLGRPSAPKVETVNDLDGMVSNFWRALQGAPDEVAYWADWPVNENDQHARHLWLVGQKESLQTRLEGDPSFYDVKIAGWWVWGICCWIGSGFCSGVGPWQSIDGELVNTSDAGQGIRRQRPHLGHAGQGILRQRPHLGDAGQGIHRQRPHLGGGWSPGGQGIHNPNIPTGNIHDYMCALADRLRGVRVCCGDWARVCGPTPTVKQGLTGVFLDPPYADTAERTANLYAADSLSVAHDVREWCIEWGDNERIRIALCGYDTEHAMPGSWCAVPWKAHGGLGAQGNGRGRDNSTREVIWFSPHCLTTELF